MASVEIGPMLPGDREAAAACIASGEIFQRYGLTFASAVDLLARSRGEIVVARARSETVGVAIYWTDGTMPAPAYLRLLAVREGARGEGVGEALLRYVEKQVARCRPSLFLCCTTTNEGARRFYERHGYQAVGVLTDLVVEGIDEVLYRKVLVAKRNCPRNLAAPRAVFSPDQERQSDLWPVSRPSAQTAIARRRRATAGRGTGGDWGLPRVRGVALGLTPTLYRTPRPVARGAA